MAYIYIYIYMSVTLMRMLLQSRNMGSRRFRALVCVGLESESRAYTTASEQQLAKRSRRNGVLDWPAF